MISISHTEHPVSGLRVRSPFSAGRKGANIEQALYIYHLIIYSSTDNKIKSHSYSDGKGVYVQACDGLDPWYGIASPFFMFFI